MNSYEKFKRGLISKDKLLEGLYLKEGIYYIKSSKIPIF